MKRGDAMKLYDFSLAPNSRRVRVFLAEKGIDTPLVSVNTRENEHFSAWFREKNSACTVLELDDGTCISESVAICRYFEEIQPEPALFGTGAKERALVEMWNRRAELEGQQAVAQIIRNSAPMFKDRALAGVRGVPQIPALIERGKASLCRFFETIDQRLGETRYLAGESFSIADITAFVAIGFAGRVEIGVPNSCANANRWFADVSARLSAEA
ncbi:MAG: glutathione S-transferase family protein [Alphaproteobacteria bacterium]|nr:glutathione S-transferase family protein [Alphaproteobacteria bacterium]MDP7174183.1 glutathione S-transferase family protein [Alphaproteobacteria bacterium]MEE1545056.1 glutathione S-transferase family protein [Alphaproteobacteria bacterium]